MKNVLYSAFFFVISTLRSRVALQLENLALRHQLSVYKHSKSRPKIKVADRLFWVCLSKVWSNSLDSLIFVKPETLIKWQRKRFKDHWANLSKQGKRGRSKTDKEIRSLIRKMSKANPFWGSPRILGELKKLGIEVAKSTVEKYMIKRKKPPSQTWKTFLKNHASEMVSIDFFTVPTVKFEVLFVFLVLSNYRRRIVHFNITQNPSAEWTAQQIIEAFTWDTVPKYLIRDRDGIYGNYFHNRVKNMRIKEVVIAPRSSWQNPYAERVIGSIRRDCLNHVIIFSDKQLKQVLRNYFSYCQSWRTHLSLDMDCPVSRAIQYKKKGKLIALPEVGGLHHHYEWKKAA